MYFYKNTSLITRINASAIERLYKDLGLEGLLGNIYLYTANKNITKLEDEENISGTERGIKTVYEKVVDNVLGKNIVSTELAIYISLQVGKLIQNYISIKNLIDTRLDTFKEILRYYNDPSTATDKELEKTMKSIKRSKNSEFNREFAKSVEELEKNYKSVIEMATTEGVNKEQVVSMLIQTYNKTDNIIKLIRDSTKANDNYLYRYIREKGVDIDRTSPYTLNLRDMARKLDKMDIQEESGKITEQIKQLSTVFYKEENLNELSEIEKVIISYIHNKIQNNNDKVEDILAYLGDIDRTYTMTNRQKVLDEYSSIQTTYGFGFDLSKMKMTADSILDEDLFNLKIVKGELKIKSQEEEPAGYGSFIMVIDRSDSMTFEDKDKKATAIALYYGIQAIRRGIDFGIVEFARTSIGYVIQGNTQEEKYLDLVNLLFDKNYLEENKDRYIGKEAGGGLTNYEDALNTALHLLSKHNLQNADLLFITDGEPNKREISSCAPLGNVKELVVENFLNRIFVGINVNVERNYFKEEYDIFTKEFYTNENFHLDIARAINLDDLDSIKSGKGLKL